MYIIFSLEAPESGVTTVSVPLSRIWFSGENDYHLQFLAHGGNLRSDNFFPRICAKGTAVPHPFSAESSVCFARTVWIEAEPRKGQGCVTRLDSAYVAALEKLWVSPNKSESVVPPLGTLPGEWVEGRPEAPQVWYFKPTTSAPHGGTVKILTNDAGRITDAVWEDYAADGKVRSFGSVSLEGPTHDLPELPVPVAAMLIRHGVDVRGLMQATDQTGARLMEARALSVTIAPSFEQMVRQAGAADGEELPTEESGSAKSSGKTR